MKALINSRLFKPFRKSFLKKIRKEVTDNNSLVNFCCLVKSWHTIFICWKDLKEVKENMKSKYLVPPPYRCDLPWFQNRNDRISFIDECLLKFENDNKPN